MAFQDFANKLTNSLKTTKAGKATLLAIGWVIGLSLIWLVGYYTVYLPAITIGQPYFVLMFVVGWMLQCFGYLYYQKMGNQTPAFWRGIVITVNANATVNRKKYIAVTTILGLIYAVFGAWYVVATLVLGYLLETMVIAPAVREAIEEQDPRL